MYDKYKNDKKYLKYKKAAFICSMLDTCSTVSYTHLTLPTKLEV